MRVFHQLLFEWIHGWSHRSAFVDWGGVFLATYLPWLLVLGLLVLILREPGRRARLFFFAEAALSLILSRGIVTELIRFFYDAPRPFETLNVIPLIQNGGEGSFPSGHAAFFFAIATIVWYRFPRLGTFFFAFAFLNGLGRVFAGVHWPMDVLGGAAVGIGSAFLIHSLLSAYREGLRERESE